MVSKDRTAASDLEAYLVQEGKAFSAFQAIELFIKRRDGGTEPGSHPLAADERLFFAVDHRLAFPLSDVASIRKLPSSREDTEERLQMNVAFLGLHGSGSPLPSYFAENIAQYEADESVIKAFNDFFHNRLIGLLFRAWRKPRYYLRYLPGGKDRFSGWMFSLLGLGNPEARASTRNDWARLLCFSGMLSTRNRSPSLMARVIAHAFALDSVHIEEWIQRKVRLPVDQTNRLGRANCRLGHDLLAGDSPWDIQGKIRIVINDLTFDRFQDFLPHGADFSRLRGLIEFMMRDQLAYDLKLGLLPDEAHPLTLASDCPGRLGWSSFLGRGHPSNLRDVIIPVRS